MPKFPKLRSPAILSPMSGVTDVAFRALAARYGAGLTYTEFTNGTAIMRGHAVVLKRIVTDPLEKPVAVQLFGNSVEDVIDAAKMIEHQFDVIDINCGCPAWKVIKTGSGSELLKSPDKISSFINKLASAVNKPVTVKIRIGIDDEHINALEVAKLAQDAGAAAIGIHGRTQAQGYSGTANWNIIKQVKEQIDIPVIGNGDVFTPEQFKHRLEQSGVDAIMIARGAIGNPFIFTQINQYLATGTYEKENRIEQFVEYAQIAQKYSLNFDMLKTQAMSFTKGIVGGAYLREKLTKCISAEELCKILTESIITCDCGVP